MLFHKDTGPDFGGRLSLPQGWEILSEMFLDSRSDGGIKGLGKE